MEGKEIKQRLIENYIQSWEFSTLPSLMMNPVFLDRIDSEEGSQVRARHTLKARANYH